MRLVHLEVENFRSIEKASISFGPGLTVVHGPNELGKSTLVEAIRAALFVTTGSREGDSYVTWGRATPARVVLTFDESDKRWRVNKKFGAGRRAALECSDSVDGPRFRQVAEGNNVEGQLRELLGWGVAPPGGRGAPAKPTSYLVTALLGRQGAVQGIFDASLAEDTDGTGKTMVTRALGALDKDPVVTRVLQKLTERVEQVFTPTGRQKTSSDSPLVVIQERLKQEEARLAILRDDDSRGKVVQQRVVTLQQERERFLESARLAECELDAAQARRARAEKRVTLQADIDECRRQLAEADRLAAELASLETRRGTQRAGLDRLKADETVARSALDASTRSLQLASEEVARANEAELQSVQIAEAARARKRAELESRKSALGARLKDIASAEQAQAELCTLETELEGARAVAETASTNVAEARRELEHAELSAQLHDLIQRRDTVADLTRQHDETLQRDQDARDALRAADAAVADAQSRRDQRGVESSHPEVQQAQSQLALLRAVEARARVLALRAEVAVLETDDARARDQRTHATSARAEASRLDQQIAARVLPTREQVASWRVLEAERSSASTSVAPPRRSQVVPLAVGLATGLATAIATALVLDAPGTIAALAGIVVALLVAGLIWIATSGKVADAGQTDERLRRLDERWALEVEPSLRAAGLSSLADYEYALVDVEGLRTSAARLRGDADRADLGAAAAERAAASLEHRRETLARNEREAPVVDEAALTHRLEELGADPPTVRRRIEEAEQELDALLGRLRQEADAACVAADERRRQLQDARETIVRDVASAGSALGAARLLYDPSGVERVTNRIDALGRDDAPSATVEDARTRLGRVQNDQAQATTKVHLLHERLETMRPDVDQIVSSIGESLPVARQQVLAGLAEVEKALTSIDTTPGPDEPSPADALESARLRQAELKDKAAADKAALDAATLARSDADHALAGLDTDIAARRGQLSGIDRVSLEGRLQTASNDPVFQIADTNGVEPQTARDTLDRVRLELERCTSDLNHARGQLHLIAGHVGSERLARQEDAVEYARAEVLERELTEKAALRLLREVQAAEAERASHLGRTLGGPITETFKTLTGERYGSILLDPDLRTERVESEGAPREVSALSVGTREQLATLIRLAVAAHLRTAVVLDDQLVHSDTERLAWFSERLRSSAREHGHQIIVFTCRPGDYLPAPPTPDDASVAVVDLAQHVFR